MNAKGEKKQAETTVEDVATEGVETPDVVEAPADDVAPVVDAAEQARAALQDRLVRLQADFENFRKRTARDRAEWIRTSNEDLVSELLPVLDSLELAVDAAQPGTSQDALLKGVGLVREQFASVLGKFGLQGFDAVGQTFDPTRHAAISQLASDTVPENGVIAQARRGYVLGEKLIRAAQVVVSSGKPVTETSEAGSGADAGE